MTGRELRWISMRLVTMECSVVACDPLVLDALCPSSRHSVSSCTRSAGPGGRTKPSRHYLSRIRSASAQVTICSQPDVGMIIGASRRRRERPARGTRSRRIFASKLTPVTGASADGRCGFVRMCPEVLVRDGGVRWYHCANADPSSQGYLECSFLGLRGGCPRLSF